MILTPKLQIRKLRSKGFSLGHATGMCGGAQVWREMTSHLVYSSPSQIPDGLQQTGLADGQSWGDYSCACLL